MDSYETNKIVGAILGTLFVLFGGSLLSEAIFDSEAPEKPGYVIAAAEAPAAGAGAAAVAEDPPVAALLASADPGKGASEFKKCQACHIGEKDGGNKVGPHLWNVVDRPMASVSDFAYSAGIKDFSKGSTVKWDYDHLYHFLKAPKQYIPGTAMGFAGIKDPEGRANVIAYLRSLSDNPAPLPAAPAPGAAPAGAGVDPAGPAAAPTAPGAAPAAPAERQGAATPAAGATATAVAMAGDPAEGAKVFKKCQVCHAIGPGAVNKVGPELNGIVGEAPAAVENYSFSAALKGFAASHPVWDEASLTPWLTDPKGTVPGTKMAFAGLKKPQDVANVIAYLKSFDETGAPAK